MADRSRLDATYKTMNQLDLIMLESNGDNRIRDGENKSYFVQIHDQGQAAII